jgi:hypothetical protein
MALEDSIPNRSAGFQFQAGRDSNVSPETRLRARNCLQPGISAARLWEEFSHGCRCFPRTRLTQYAGLLTMTGALKHMLTLTTAVVLVAVASPANAADTAGNPNILFVFADQWRADALGYAGDPNVKTPNLDRLANQAVKFTHAVSACPVCCPYRATMMTGRRPLSHGVFLNDVQLPGEEVTIAEVLAGRGYRTGYIGKWHLDGHGRSSYIPPERRQGFEYFKALECTHNYNRSFY